MIINPRASYILLSIFVAAFSTSGCSTNVKLTPQKADGQKVVYQDGRPVLISEKDNVVTLAPSDSIFINSNQAKFVVAVKNQGDGDFVFSTNNITADFDVIRSPKPKPNEQTALASFNLLEVFGVSKAEASTPDPTESTDPLPSLDPIVTSSVLKVFSYEDLMQAEQKRQDGAAFAAALGGLGRAMQASNAGYTNDSERSYYGSSYQAQAALFTAQEQTSADFARIQAEGVKNISELKRTILKMQTVVPGQWYGGTMVVQMPKPSDKAIPVHVVVNVGDERHEFTYLYEKVPK